MGGAHVRDHDKAFRPIVVESEHVRVITVKKMEFAMQDLIVDLRILADGNRVFVERENGIGVKFLDCHIYPLDVVLIHLITALDVRKPRKRPVIPLERSSRAHPGSAIQVIKNRLITIAELPVRFDFVKASDVR